jgi:MarR family transcriptional regulator, organic hydroperoxide resistance regulator
MLALAEIAGAGPVIGGIPARRGCTSPPGLASMKAVVDLKVVFSELIRFETELWNAIDARLQAEFDLPLTRFEPMQIMARRPECRVQDIADELVITVGGTSKLVDRIEASGYCRRRANPGDRRSSIVELTPAGNRMLARATAVFDEELQLRLGDVLPQRSLEQFGATLARLRAAAEAQRLRDQCGLLKM